MNRNLFIILSLLFIVAVAAGFFFFSRATGSKAPDPAACAGLKVAALGDSLVTGYGASTPGGFVTFLSQRTGTAITNHGENGDTAAEGLARVPEALAEQPDVVIVLLGGNDALQKVPQATTRANLDALLAQLEAAHVKIVLAGVLGGLGIDPYQSMFADLARAHHAVYVGNVLAGLIGNRQLMSDEVHPNEAGYQRIADKVYPALLAACQATKA